MTEAGHDPAARAYDALAQNYDEQVQGESWMRAALWELYERRFLPGDDVLDLGCGTGVDAVRLASRGVWVTAVDASPAMVARTRARAEQAGCGDRVTALILPFERLSSLQPRQFDGVYSSFAALSTVRDMQTFAGVAAWLLRSGGGMVVHMLNRGSLWEYLGYARHGSWAKALRTRSLRERTFVIGGLPVEHRMWRAEELYRSAFRDQFRLREARALGVLRPPPSVSRVPPRAVRALGRLEDVLGSRRPFVDWGRFFILDLERR